MEKLYTINRLLIPIYFFILGCSQPKNTSMQKDKTIEETKEYIGM